jgi:hypothetical protein
LVRESVALPMSFHMTEFACEAHARDNTLAPGTVGYRGSAMAPEEAVAGSVASLLPASWRRPDRSRIEWRLPGDRVTRFATIRNLAALANRHSYQDGLVLEIAFA